MIIRPIPSVKRIYRKQVKENHEMRLNQYISSSGLCSRRVADQWIKEGKVKVNGEIAVLGTQVNEGDQVEVNGQLITPKQKKVYLAFNKPVGITTTTDQSIQGNIVDYINYKERVFPIGRLDKDSSGLILLTNDGSIVNELLDEANQLEKDYIVTVNKNIKAAFLEKMENGVEIYNPVRNEYVITKPAKIEKINNRTFKITLTQGLNRQIRRMCSKLDYRVRTLKRIRFVNIHLADLKVGAWRYLSENELNQLFSKINRKLD